MDGCEVPQESRQPQAAQIGRGMQQPGRAQLGLLAHLLFTSADADTGSGSTYNASFVARGRRETMSAARAEVDSEGSQKGSPTAAEPGEHVCGIGGPPSSRQSPDSGLRYAAGGAGSQSQLPSQV